MISPWRSPSAHSGHGALVGVDADAPSGKPDALVPLHVRQRPLEVPDAERLADDHRVQRQAEHARLRRAVGLERVELGAELDLAALGTPVL